jgi:serpin B
MTPFRSRPRPPRRRRVALVALTAVVVAGSAAACGDDGDDDEGEQAAGDVILVESDAARAEPSPDAPVDDVVAGLDAFALEAERRVAAEAEGGNTVLSPVSIGTAFAMVSAGAGDPTGAQIDEVFGFPAQDGLHPAMNALTTALDDANVSDPERGDVVVEATNTLWAQQGFDIEPAFLDTLATEYGAAVPTVDFRSDPEGGRRSINDQVAEATRDRITDLMGEGSVTEDTRAVVVNALYLKAPWATEFSEDATEPGTFHLADGGTAEVPMMHDSSLSTRAAVGAGYTAVELPYVGGDLAMLLVVPDEGTALDDVLAGLGEGGLGTVAGQLGDATVDLTLPRWDTGSATDLAPLLTDLGLPIPGGTLPGVAPDLELSAAVHAANITVDEHGTEAAAATAVGMEITSAPVPGEIVEVVADRPFLFAVRHVETGAPLFVGRVGDPRG